jgi:hypothetical protein
VQLVREVVLERAAVDRDGAGAGNQADACDGLLAAADGCAGNAEQGRSTITASWSTGVSVE